MSAVEHFWTLVEDWLTRVSFSYNCHMNYLAVQMRLNWKNISIILEILTRLSTHYLCFSIVVASAFWLDIATTSFQTTFVLLRFNHHFYQNPRTLCQINCFFMIIASIGLHFTILNIYFINMIISCILGIIHDGYPLLDHTTKLNHATT
jgi:hypothetical protein